MANLSNLFNRLYRIALLAAAIGILLSAPAAKAQTIGGKITIDPDGTYHIPAQNIPVTEYLSPEGKASLLRYDTLEQHHDQMVRYPDGTVSLFKPYEEADLKMYPLDKQDTKIAGVHVIVYQRKEGIPADKRDKVLIQLHGGAFRNCWEDCGQLETTPIAYLSQIKTVSVDYRQGADHPFPAAQEDVAAVYTELLKTYKPQNIGIFGCSAGGRLTGMMAAWFIEHNMPSPGAIMMACAGLGGDRGDAEMTSAELGEGTLGTPGRSDVLGRTGYFRTADPEDPMVQPIKSPAILAHYPPTLIVTGTRAHDFSSSVYAHEALFKSGVDAHLYVVEGGRHGFWYDPTVPEAREVCDVIVKFFNDYLGKPAQKPRFDLGSIPAARTYPPAPPAPAAAPAQEARYIQIDEDGTYHIPAQTVPPSSYLSKEAIDSLVYYDTTRRDRSNGIADAEGAKKLFKPYRDRQAQLYPLNIEDTKMGGVHVFVYTPKDGVAAKNQNRVLIELHGGGCWNDCGHLESQPIAYVGKIKVVSIDYRENAYPGGVEDVASVYSDLLKTHSPQQIGIYGCSAGGALTARSLAWFQTHNLPNPGAAGILCSSAGSPHGRGDAAYTAAELGEGLMPDENTTNPAATQTANVNDPMYSPVNSPAMLAKFPPTLMITGTRSMEVSSAVYTHAQLVKAGVNAELHVLEGARHGFWYDPAPPESKEVYRIIIDYFDRHLATSGRGTDLGAGGQ